MYTLRSEHQARDLQLLLSTFLEFNVQGKEYIQQVVCKAYVDSGENLDMPKDWPEDRIEVKDFEIIFQNTGPMLVLYIEYDDTPVERANSYLYLKAVNGALHGEY